MSNTDLWGLLKKIITKVQENPKVDAPAVILLRAILNDRETLLTSLKQRISIIKLAKSPPRKEYTVVTDPPIIPEKPFKPRKVSILQLGRLLAS